MLKKTLTAAVAAAVLSACPAQAAETIDYRIGLNMAGTWSETVRADLDENDVDRDGTEEVAARDTSTRFALTRHDAARAAARRARRQAPLRRRADVAHAGDVEHHDRLLRHVRHVRAAGRGRDRRRHRRVGRRRPRAAAVERRRARHRVLAAVRALEHVGRPAARRGVQRRAGVGGGAGRRGVRAPGEALRRLADQRARPRLGRAARVRALPARGPRAHGRVPVRLGRAR